MIVFFGPAGSGKSIQGKLLAARFGWRWLSAGQQLRDSGDPDIIATMKAGKLIPSKRVHEIMLTAFQRSQDMDSIVLDGFPRMLEEARWLLQARELHGRAMQLAVVLDVPETELLGRLQLRGRSDDTPEAIHERLSIYRQETDQILDYLAESGIKIVHINGVGSIGAIHDMIAEEVEKVLDNATKKD